MAALPTLGGSLMLSNIQTIGGADFTNQDVQSALSAPMPGEAVAVEDIAPEPLPYANKGLMGLQYLANMKNQHTALKDPNQGDMNLIQTILSNTDKSNPYMGLANLPFMYLLGKTNAASQSFEADKQAKIAEWTAKHEDEIKAGISELEKRNESAAQFAAIEKKFKDSMDVLAKGIAARKSGVSSEQVNALFDRYGINMDTSKIPTDEEVRQKAADLKDERDAKRDAFNAEQTDKRLASSEKRTFAAIEGMDRRAAAREANRPDKTSGDDKKTEKLYVDTKTTLGKLQDGYTNEDARKLEGLFAKSGDPKLAKIKVTPAWVAATMKDAPTAGATEAPKKKGFAEGLANVMGREVNAKLSPSPKGETFKEYYKRMAAEGKATRDKNKEDLRKKKNTSSAPISRFQLGQ